MNSKSCRSCRLQRIKVRVSVRSSDGLTQCFNDIASAMASNPFVSGAPDPVKNVFVIPSYFPRTLMPVVRGNVLGDRARKAQARAALEEMFNSSSNLGNII